MTFQTVHLSEGMQRLYSFPILSSLLTAFLRYVLFYSMTWCVFFLFSVVVSTILHSLCCTMYDCSVLISRMWLPACVCLPGNAYTSPLWRTLSCVLLCEFCFVPPFAVNIRTIQLYYDLHSFLSLTEALSNSQEFLQFSDLYFCGD